MQLFNCANKFSISLVPTEVAALHMISIIDRRAMAFGMPLVIVRTVGNEWSY